jgi:hypothetical protein
MATARTRVLTGMMAAILILVFHGVAYPASPEPGDPTYHSLGYNDDFSYLANQPATTDFWYPLKYTPIGDGRYDPTWLSLGGKLRARFESYFNPNFGFKPPKSNAYLLHRMLLRPRALCGGSEVHCGVPQYKLSCRTAVQTNRGFPWPNQPHALGQLAPGRRIVKANQIALACSLPPRVRPRGALALLLEHGRGTAHADRAGDNTSGLTVG